MRYDPGDHIHTLLIAVSGILALLARVRVAPKFVRPLHPRLPPRPSLARDGWLHEPKLDGYRFQIVRMAAALRLHSKSGSDWTKRLSLLAEALAGIRCKSAVIDAELVFPTSEGHPDFRALQAAIGDRTRHHLLAVFAFDFLHHNGKDLPAASPH